MATEPTLSGALRGLVLLALLWWAWCSYAWLGNRAHADEGIARSTLIVAMAGMFVVALTPKSRGQLVEPGQPPPALGHEASAPTAASRRRAVRRDHPRVSFGVGPRRLDLAVLELAAHPSRNTCHQ